MATSYNKTNIMTLVQTTRQRLGFKKGNMFEPTPNIRNPHMLEEAEAFSPQLRTFERAVRDYHRHVQGFLGSLIPLLEENLPRVWTAVSGSLAEPVRPQISHGHPNRIGGDFSSALILERLEVLNRGMEEDILAPLRRWQEGLAIAKERMNSLEKLRKDVDKQRRTAEKKFKRHESKLRRAYLGAGYGSSSSSDDVDDTDYIVPRGRLLEDYQRLALHTERHLQALMDSYADQERLLWEQLSGLVTDAAWLESYAAAAMLKVKETMQAVALALGPCKQPLPAFRHAAYPFEGQYGQIGHNIELIKAMGPRARELASGAKPAGTDYLPYTALRAKRGVSTPLMVAAAARPGRQQQTLSMQPVPPIQVGAGAIPLEAVPPRLAADAQRRVEEHARGSGIRVADHPGLPAALTPTPASAGMIGGSTMSPLTPSPRGRTAAAAPAGVTGGRYTTTGTTSGASGMATGVAGGQGGKIMSSSVAAPAGAGAGSRTVVGTSSPGGMARIPEGDSSNRSGGIIYKTAEAAGAAVSSVTTAARTAAESFREGVAEGEATGHRDVDRVVDTAERAGERVSDTAAAVVAPVTERLGMGTAEGVTTTTIPASSKRTTTLPSEAGSRGYDMPAGSPAMAAGVHSGTGPVMPSEGVAMIRVDRSPRVSEPTSLTERVSDSSAVAAPGPMSAAAASPRHTLMQQQQPGMFGGSADGEREISAGGMGMGGQQYLAGHTGVMSERSERGAGMSDITGETDYHHHSDYDLDSFVSAVKPSRTAGMKQQHGAMAAAPAGFDDPALGYTRSGGRTEQQHEGGGGIFGAVRRAVGV